MTRRIGMVAVAAAVVLAAGADPALAAEKNAGLAFSKLGRGFVNTITGWVEIPKRIQETSQTSGAATGWTWGLLRGVGHGLIRTAAGLYEVVSFPFPAPAGYVPILQPEYVFTQGVGSAGY